VSFFAALARRRRESLVCSWALKMAVEFIMCLQQLADL
jgi:hypothetical protein